jgi:hypothetical protein
MVTQTDSDNIWYILGRLEEGQRRLEEGQRRLEAAMVENQRRTDAALLDIQAGLRDVNRRVDRLYYVILGMGAAVIAATFASRFLGG